jgi:hypothetical protein
MKKIQYCTLRKVFIVILFERKFVLFYFFYLFGCLLLFDLNSFLVQATVQQEDAFSTFDLEKNHKEI